MLVLYLITAITLFIYLIIKTKHIKNTFFYLMASIFILPAVILFIEYEYFHG